MGTWLREARFEGSTVEVDPHHHATLARTFVATLQACRHLEATFPGLARILRPGYRVNHAVPHRDRLTVVVVMTYARTEILAGECRRRRL